MLTRAANPRQKRVAEGDGVLVTEKSPEQEEMCLTCGCKNPHDNHGKSDYLTIEKLERSAQLDKMSLDEAVRNLVATVDVAKKETEHKHR